METEIWKGKFFIFSIVQPSNLQQLDDVELSHQEGRASHLGFYTVNRPCSTADHH